MAGPDVTRSVTAHLVGDDVRETGLAQTGRAVKQDVIERFAALPRRFDQDAEIFLQADPGREIRPSRLGRKARSSAVSSSRA